MKAAIYTRYGPPEVITVGETDKPVPAANEILIKIHATTVNRTDCGFRSAVYFVSRFWSGLLRPRFHTLGCEFAGQVEAIGSDVTSFQIGDRVFGYNDEKFGAHAEYITIAETGAVATIPEHLTYEEAAPLTEGAHYALGNIRAAKISGPQHVLVYGATGAIGSAAVQLLKYFGAKVTAVCNTKNMDLVRSLGADVVISYMEDDFTKISQRFDFIFDAVGKSSFRQCKPLLNKKGIYISTELGKNSANVFLALITPLFGGKKVLFPIPSIRKEDVQFLGQLAKDHQFKPVIDRQYSLDQIVEAYRYVETGQKTGNVIIRVGEKDQQAPLRNQAPANI
ncbi:NAD(P)-dependent alcohol dehydrogenase [Chitinophaga cymbidii]|nr:NAD(P)-dependent alcohol dehydrogenase [Chitinophaga cymbidii]